MEKEIEKKAVTLFARVKGSMIEETGISSSVEEEDMKSYLQEVREEVKNKGKHS